MLRGVGPADPRMRNENLRAVCTGLGFSNVATVISSGNIVFDADAGPGDIEAQLEAAWPDQLGFASQTFVRSQMELEALEDLLPFGDLTHGNSTYLLATFAKTRLSVPFDLPHQPTDEAFKVVAAADRALFSVSDTTVRPTPDVMRWLEREIGRDITSRTWLTVHRILKRMGRPRHQ